MKDLLIIGARGFGREVYHIAQRSHGFQTAWQIKGFLDSDLTALDGMNGYPPIISAVETYNVQPNDIFCCALGSVVEKKKYCQMILEKGGEFANIIHKNSQLFLHTSNCKGLIVSAFTSITCDIRLGDFITFQNHVTVGHDASIGSWCHLNAYSFVGGYCVIEDEVTLHTGSKILPKVRIGRESTVGAGSVAVKNVPPGTTVFGVPAKKLAS